ncbi:hypothetical protein ACPA9J_27090 [Pseudomonas aeruginosa]
MPCYPRPPRQVRRHFREKYTRRFHRRRRRQDTWPAPAMQYCRRAVRLPRTSSNARKWAMPPCCLVDAPAARRTRNNGERRHAVIHVESAAADVQRSSSGPGAHSARHPQPVIAADAESRNGPAQRGESLYFIAKVSRRRSHQCISLQRTFTPPNGAGESQRLVGRRRRRRRPRVNGGQPVSCVLLPAIVGVSEGRYSVSPVRHGRRSGSRPPSPPSICAANVAPSVVNRQSPRRRIGAVTRRRPADQPGCHVTAVPQWRAR